MNSFKSIYHIATQQFQAKVSTYKTLACIISVHTNTNTGITSLYFYLSNTRDAPSMQGRCSSLASCVCGPSSGSSGCASHLNQCPWRWPGWILIGSRPYARWVHHCMEAQNSLHHFHSLYFYLFSMGRRLKVKLNKENKDWVAGIKHRSKQE